MNNGKLDELIWKSFVIKERKYYIIIATMIHKTLHFFFKTCSHRICWKLLNNATQRHWKTDIIINLQIVRAGTTTLPCRVRKHAFRGANVIRACNRRGFELGRGDRPRFASALANLLLAAEQQSTIRVRISGFRVAPTRKSGTTENRRAYLRHVLALLILIATFHVATYEENHKL